MGFLGNLLQSILGSISGEDFGQPSDEQRKAELKRHWITGTTEEIRMTSIRPDLGDDPTTASKYVERHTVVRKAKK